jgi:hypothetical protein
MKADITNIEAERLDVRKRHQEKEAYRIAMLNLDYS